LLEKFDKGCTKSPESAQEIGNVEEFQKFFKRLHQIEEKTHSFLTNSTKVQGFGCKVMDLWLKSVDIYWKIMQH